MIIFFSGGSGIPWQASIGLLVLSSVLGGPFLGGGLRSFFHYDQAVDTRGVLDDTEEESLGWGAILCLGVAGFCGYFFCVFALQVSRHVQAFGLRNTLRRLWQTPVQQWHSVLRPQRRRAPGTQRPSTLSHNERFALVTDKVAKLPIETYVSKEDLECLSLHDLKIQLQAMGFEFKPGEAIDRCEAIRIALQKGGSSSESCTICCEDYKSQDTMRRLPKCRHCFHLECIDRWLLSTAEYSDRKPSCPMCNTVL